MPEPTTLPALTRAERIALDPRSDRDILDQARSRFQLAMEAERDERAQQKEAIDFRGGSHWPNHLLAIRQQPGRERPCLVIPRQQQYIEQVINAYRRAPLGMRVRPKSGGATQQVAEILEGKLRDIEQDSEADIAYTVALDQATGQGLGYFRLTLDYEADDSFQQCVRIRPLYNRFAVYLDPASVHPAGLDAEWGFVVERWSESKFQQCYEVSSRDLAAWCGPDDAIWHHEGQVQVAEYYYRTWANDTLVQAPGLPPLFLSEWPRELELDPRWPTRPTCRPRVWWAKMCGYAILERTRWLGRYIPILRVEGKRLDKDGTTQRTGMVQASADAQLAYDYARSAEAEAIALTPKAPYVVYDETIAGYEDEWDNANDAQQPYLRIRAVTKGPQLLPPPRREVAEPAVQAITQAAMLAAEDIKATLGMYDASVGARSNETSGVAIEQRKLEGDQTNYTYPANLAWSIRACGVQLLDLLPRLYSGPTTLRQVGQDGTITHTPVNQSYRDGQGQMQQHILAQGQYDVVVSSGPSYETNRVATADKLGALIGAVPQTAPYLLDVWAGALDFPGSDELAQRLRTLVPPEALAASEQTDPRTQLVQLQNQLTQATQALQQAQQQLQQSQTTEQAATQQVALLERTVADMKVQLDNKQRELEVDARKAQWDYETKIQKNQIDWRELELKYGLGAPNGALVPQNGPMDASPGL